MQRLTRRRFAAVFGFGGACAALAAACSQAGPAPASPTVLPASGIGPTVLPTVTASPSKGKLLIVQGGNFQIFDLSTLALQPLSHFPKGAFAASPSLSHDRTKVAYTYYVVPTDPKDLGGSDLWTMDPSAANQKLAQGHGVPGATYEDPCWTSDGAAILATLREPIYSGGQYQGESLSIKRVPLDGSDPTTVLKNALGPGTSPDGKSLVYTTVDDKGNPGGLFRAAADGSNPTELLANQGFAIIRAPTFSPDGSLVTFAAVGGPRTNPPTPAASGLLPGVGIAEAHGIPWDIWTVRPDGSELKQLTHESEDTPTPVWSPDGKWIAFAGEIGLYLVDAAGKSTVRLSTAVSGGGIAWIG